MFKKVLYLTFAALALVACGDDDPEEVNPPKDKKYTKLVMTADMKFSADLIRLADITVYYMKEGGEIVNETITDSVWKNTVTQTIPCQAGLAITYSVKPDLELSAEDRFYIKNSGALTMIPYTESGKAGAVNIHTVSLTLNGVHGDKVAEALSKKHVKVGYAYTTDGKHDSTNIQWGF